MSDRTAAILFGVLFAVSAVLNVVFFALLWLGDVREDALEQELAERDAELERERALRQQLWSASAETLAESKTEPANRLPQDWFGADEQEGE